MLCWFDVFGERGWGGGGLSQEVDLTDRFECLPLPKSRSWGRGYSAWFLLTSYSEFLEGLLGQAILVRQGVSRTNWFVA